MAGTGHNNPPPPTLTEVVTTLRTLGKTELPKQLARWLDELDETGRWALLKLVTGAMRIGISARLAKTAAAALGDKDPHEVELIWPGLTPPYLDLFAWLEGRADKPVNLDPAPFRPVMLAHAIEDTDFAGLNAADYIAEWKWDGIRVQAVSGRDDRGHTVARLYSRSGEDITKSFPDLLPSLHLPGAIDGELLGAARGPRAKLQCAAAAAQPQSGLAEADRRTTRSICAPMICSAKAITICARCRSPSAATGWKRSSQRLDDPRIDLSPTIAFDSWDELPRRAPIRPAPAPARMPRPSKA